MLISDIYAYLWGRKSAKAEIHGDEDTNPRINIEQGICERETENRIIRHPIWTIIQILLAGISLSSSLVFAPIVLGHAVREIEHIKYKVIAVVVLCAIGIIAGLVAFILRFHSLKQNDFRVKSNSIFYIGPVEIFLIEIASAIGMASYTYYKWNELLNVLKDFVCPVNICG